MEITNSWKALLSAIVVVGVSFASSASSDELDGTWKPPAVGAKISYSDGYSCEVIRIDGNEVHCKGDRSDAVKDTEWIDYMGMYYSISDADGSEYVFDRAAIQNLFPLEVGNKSVVAANDGQWYWKTTFEVTGIKDIETLLGTRRVFSITYKDEGTGGNTYSGKGFGYYDPELAIWHHGAYKAKGSGRVDWEATNIELPQ